MPSDGVGDQMNIPTPPDAGNQFEAQLLSWKVPPETVREILEYHSNLTYAPGAMIFWQGAGRPGRHYFLGRQGTG